MPPRSRTTLPLVQPIVPILRGAPFDDPDWNLERDGMRKALAAVCLVLSSVRPISAQNERPMPLVLQLPMNTRALGMGNAYVLAQGDADALFYHPGLLDTSRGIALSMSRYGSESSLFAPAAAAEWYRGGVALGLQTLSYSEANFGAGAFARDADGIAAVGLWCADGFDTELVLPVVPKVIVVEETFTQSEAKVCKEHLMGVVTEADASDLGNSVLFPLDAELVEVGIGPPESDLEE